ncbi:MAG: hypothetical protein CMF59_13565 [Leptospiraceae bacterium]|nr:hypothetical protein [Leptospiraceae bacterium]
MCFANHSTYLSRTSTPKAVSSADSMEGESCRVIPFPNPKRKVKGYPPEWGHEGFLGKGLSDGTVRQLMKQFSAPKDERGYRDRAILWIALHSGLRAHELTQLRWSDAVESPEGETLFRVRCKGGRIGYCLLGERVLEIVREYNYYYGDEADTLLLTLPNRALGGKRGPLSTRGLQKIIQSWGVETCSGRPIHPHALRHTAIQKAFDNGGSIFAQKLAGHSNPTTTSRFYTRPYVDPTDLLNWEVPEAGD